MTTTSYDFLDTEVPTEKFDAIPPVDDIQAPCTQCGREAGTTATGRKRKLCESCKPSSGRTSTRSVRVTGNAQNLAAQAAKTLAGINMMLALCLGGLKFFRSAGALSEKNEDFENAAYQALLTDPKFAQSIVSVGGVSGKAMLGMAYLSLGMGVAPILAEEIRERKAMAEQEI